MNRTVKYGLGGLGLGALAVLLGVAGNIYVGGSSRDLRFPSALAAASDPASGSRRGSLTPDTLVYTKEQADRLFLREHQSLLGYATERWVDERGFALTNDFAWLDLSPVELSGSAEERGVSFVCSKRNPDDGTPCGEEQNAALEIGQDARAKMDAGYLDTLPDGTAARSVSIALGGCADALVEGSERSQAIAIGWHAKAKASNAIAIGSGAEHVFENAEQGTGDATYAGANEAVAVGYSAKATAPKSVQLGSGVNSSAETLQFRSFRLLKANGQVPVERLEDASADLRGRVLADMARALHAGNMTVLCDGTEESESNVLEPRLDGLSEVGFVPVSNGVYRAGTEAGIRPPFGSRNYDLLFNEIPVFKKSVGGVDVAVDSRDNFILDFSNIQSVGVVPRISCAASVGYVNGLMVSVTNAPLVVKVRETAPGVVRVAVKPWSDSDL